MTDTITHTAAESWSPDKDLIRECLNGNSDAWSALIDKYKNLIFSVPVKYGFSPQDADEIFQAVCLTLLRELPDLREPRALPAWLIRVTVNTCRRYRQDRLKYIDGEIPENMGGDGDLMPNKLMEDFEREQIVREVVSEQSPECRKLIQMLFFDSPPLPYEKVASALGMAKGSIGATRGRCLDKLRRALDKRRFL